MSAGVVHAAHDEILCRLARRQRSNRTKHTALSSVPSRMDGGGIRTQESVSAADTG